MFSHLCVILFTGGLCMMLLPVWLLEVLCSGGSLSGGQRPPETPRYRKEWVVCILLECILIKTITTVSVFALQMYELR